MHPYHHPTLVSFISNEVPPAAWAQRKTMNEHPKLVSPLVQLMRFQEERKRHEGCVGPSQGSPQAAHPAPGQGIPDAAAASLAG